MKILSKKTFRMARRPVEVVSVMSIQRLSAEEIVRLFERVNAGTVILKSIYVDADDRIGLSSRQLKRFLERQSGMTKPSVNTLIATLSKGWSNYDESGLSAKTQRENSKDFRKTQKKRFAIKKLFR